jgi:hypothetical protein
MMKRVFPVLLVFFAGCIVQSFYPFYTDKSKVTLPQLNGTWEAVTVFGETKGDPQTRLWQISNDQIIVNDGDSLPSQIHVTFFKLGGQLFCDSVAGDPDDKKSAWYWVWHNRRVHTVTKVETNGDQIVLKPLDLEWLTNNLVAGQLSLPHIERAEDDNWPLFTAPPTDWEQFLKARAYDTNAFPNTHIYVLKRHAAIPKKESPSH